MMNSYNLNKRNAIRLDCDKFVSGHLPLKAGEEFAQMAKFCADYNLTKDFYGEGVLINGFEEKIKDLLGFEAACFMPSGIMAQSIALRIYAEKMKIKNFAAHPTNHLELHTHHGYSQLVGLEAILIGERERLLSAHDIESLKVPVASVIIELPMREIGGQLPEWEELEKIKKNARQRRFFLHLDGARLWETQNFYQKSYAEICANFDSVYVSFYKGIGALGGAMLLGSTDFISESRVWLRRFGGNLFQLHPYVVSAALCFDKALTRMPSYMQRTTAICDQLQKLPFLSVLPNPPQVNLFHLFINARQENLEQARDEIANEQGLWMVDNFYPTVVPDWSYCEIYVGEGLMEFSDEEVCQAFIELTQKAKQN